MHGVSLCRAKHFPKPNLNSNMEALDSFDRRGLLDLPVSLPSIPVLDPLLTLIAGGPTPTSLLGNNILNPTSPPPQDPPQPAPANLPNPGNDNGFGNSGEGGDNRPTLPNPGSGNVGVPNPDPNASPNPNPSTPPSTPTPALNLDAHAHSSASDPPNPTHTSGSPPPQSSGTPQSGSVDLFEPNPQGSSSGYSPGGPDGSEDVVFTTVSGMKTEVTRLPQSANGGTEPGVNPISGGGNGSGNNANSSGRRSLGVGIISGIVICSLLVLALFLFFLRKRVKARREAQHTHWLSSDERGPRNTLRSSFGDLRASTFGYQSDDGDDASNAKRDSRPFSDMMAVPPLTPGEPSDPQMTQVTRTKIASPAIAVHSPGRRSTRNSQLSIGSSESSGSDGSDAQWVHIRPDMRYRDSASPTDQFYLPSPISVRPFTPTDTWLFPRPPSSRVQSLVVDRGSKGTLAFGPFADSVRQSSSSGFQSVEVVTKTFEPVSADELGIEIGDEVSVLRLFDDGWGRVKVLKRDGSGQGVEGLEGLVPIGCFRSRENEEGAKLHYAR